jgi:hypothetical protein
MLPGAARPIQGRAVLCSSLLISVQIHPTEPDTSPLSALSTNALVVPAVSRPQHLGTTVT